MGTSGFVHFRAKRIIFTLLILVCIRTVCGQHIIEFQDLDVPKRAYAGTWIQIKVTLLTSNTKIASDKLGLQFRFSPTETYRNVSIVPINAAEEMANTDVRTYSAFIEVPKTTGTKQFQLRFEDKETPARAIQVGKPVKLEDAQISVGYQGWFATPNDGVLNRWNHWFDDIDDFDHPTQDLWPSVTAKDYPDRIRIALKFNDGSDVYLFSNAHQSTANTHVRWMMESGLQAFFVGRFLEPITKNKKFREFRNVVMQNMINAADSIETGAETLKYAIFYNLTTRSKNPESQTDYLNEMWADWKQIVDHKNWVQKANYLKKNGKPVLRIYGIGFKRRPSGITAAEAKNTLRKFTDATHPEYREKYSAYIIGAVPPLWHVGGNEAFRSTDWKEVYEMYDMIHPWMVNRYQNKKQVNRWIENVIVPDLARINELHASGREVGYLPLIFPGFSWFNLNGAYNVAPRQGGDFYWHQGYSLLKAGAVNLMIANFDEVDEGTAIFKCAADSSKLPDPRQFTAERKFLHLNQGATDGVLASEDWYLTLSKKVGEMVRGVRPLQDKIPLQE